jgi:hypothetical protein
MITENKDNAFDKFIATMSSIVELPISIGTLFKVLRVDCHYLGDNITLDEKYSFYKTETIWKPCGNLIATFHVA